MILKKSINYVKHKINVILKKDILFPENEIFLKELSLYKKAYILGSSPTIGKLDLKKLDQNALIISMGNFHEHPDIKVIKPNIHIFTASHEPITQEVLSNWWERCNSILEKNTTVLLENRNVEVGKRIFNDRPLYTYSYGGNYPPDFRKKIVTPWSVTQVALQLCINSGIKETFLLGVNHDWQSCCPYEHFFKSSLPSLEYYLHQKGIKTRNEQLKQPMPKEKMYRSYELYQGYELLKTQFEAQGLKIYNGDPLSSFDVFEKKVLSNILIESND